MPTRIGRGPLERALLRWYEPRHASFPWRRTTQPYRVLVSEIMLQQTQASRVNDAYPAFVRRFPTARALAAASRADVLRAWSGLGYNRRAIALHESAKAIATDGWPRDAAGLRALPGVGTYTAAAVASICFGAPVAAKDVNVRRVIGRLALGRDDAPGPTVDAEADRLVSRTRPGDWNQALMDLGREVCVRRAPRCGSCPVAGVCRFRKSGAVPMSSAPTQAAFEGSFRQVRGAVVRCLGAAPGRVRMGTLIRETGLPARRVTEAVCRLADEGLVEASAGARDGRRGALVGLSR